MRCCSRKMRLDVAIAVVLATVSLWSVGGMMRETDQASLLDGSIRLARGETPWLSATAYNYDKQFFSYWLLAAVWKCGSIGGLTADFSNVGLAGNLAAAVVFWGGMLWLVARQGEGRMFPAMLVLGVLAAPAVWLNSAVLNANVLSAGFLALLAERVGARETTGYRRLVVVGVLAFCAVGARADAVLCLPFLCWVTTRGGSLGRMARRGVNWAMFWGAAAALATGIAISAGAKVYVHPPMGLMKVMAAYTIFGLGGGLAAFLAVVGLAIGGAAAKVRSARRWFYIAGAVFALAPLAFYGFQLYTPRHLMTTAWVALFFAMFWQGRVMVRGLAGARWLPRLGGVVGLMAVGMMLLGLRLPEVREPRLVTAGATLFPTADGLWPMGASFDFMRRQRYAEEEEIDHNQSLWEALATVDFEEVEGVVPVFGTTLMPYFELAATLRGKKARIVPPDDYKAVPFLYADERMLRRSPKATWSAADTKGEMVAALREFPKREVSATGSGQAILRLELKGGGNSDENVERRLALANVFGGDEFVVEGEVGGKHLMRVEERGRVAVYYAEEPFRLNLMNKRGDAKEMKVEVVEYKIPRGGTGRVYCVKLDGAATNEAFRFDLVESEGRVEVARAVLPAYMSMGELE